MTDLIVGALVVLIIGNATYATWKQAKKGGCAGCSCDCKDNQCKKDKEGQT